jgi:uncharacterized protein YndB with AHSA1/START domain
MASRTVAHSTFVVKRSYPTTPARVFDAFADPVKKRRWMVEGEGFVIDSFEMDFRIGGEERSRFRYIGDRTLHDGTPMGSVGSFQDIVPERRIVFAYTMTVAEKRTSVSLGTVELLPSEKGTDLIYTGAGCVFRRRRWRTPPRRRMAATP